MGPEDKNEEMVVYCDGQPVGAATGLPEITVDPEKIAEIATTLGAAWDAIVVTVKAADTALVKLLDAIVVQAMAAAEFRRAMRWAEAYNRPLAYRYHHAKKKRTRKKYAKRIVAWYRAEVIGGGD